MALKARDQQKGSVPLRGIIVSDNIFVSLLWIIGVGEDFWMKKAVSDFIWEMGTVGLKPNSASKAIV